MWPVPIPGRVLFCPRAPRLPELSSAASIPRRTDVRLGRLAVLDRLLDREARRTREEREQTRSKMKCPPKLDTNYEVHFKKQTGPDEARQTGLNVARWPGQKKQMRLNEARRTGPRQGR